MNKLCRLTVTIMWLLTMPMTSAEPRLKLKPSLSISFNKRSICAEIENKYYLSSLAGNAGIIKNFANKPFGAISTNYQTDNYLGPGYTYIQDNTFTLKKTGIAKANAAATDAIDGSKLLVLLYTQTVQDLGYIATNGQLLFPIESVETADAVSTLTYPDLEQSWDGLTELLNQRTDGGLLGTQPAPTFSYVTSGTSKLLKIVTAENSGLFNNGSLWQIKKYYQQDTSKKYYIVMGAITESPQAGAISNNINYFDDLVTYDISNEANTYTQMDYEHADYYGVTMGVTAEYALTDYLFLDVQADLTTPVEKITHTGKFLQITPEADTGIKAGLSFGNQNGNIGLLFGVVYDRFTANIKRFTTPSGGRYLEYNENKVHTFATCREFNANIRLTSQIDAFFSTILTSTDYKIDLKGSTKRSPVTDQRFAFGFSMNYQ